MTLKNDTSGLFTSSSSKNQEELPCVIGLKHGLPQIKGLHDKKS